MNTRTFWLGVALLSSGLVHATPILSQPAESSPTISMDVTEAYLEDVLKVLSKQSGMNFVASDSVRGRTVTLYFERVPVSDAVASILKANRLALKSEASGNLFVVIDSGAPEIATVTRVFQLKYARVIPSAGETSATFGTSGSLIREILGSGGTGGGGGGAAGQFGGAGGAGSGGILQIVKSLLTAHGTVTTDPRTNSLIVTEIPERMAVIEDTIARLDIRPRQIFIEAEVLEITLDTLRRIGLEYGTSTGQVATYNAPSRTSYFPFSRGLFDGATRTNTLGTFSLADLDAILKLLATEKDVKFLARPRLLTLSNEVAEIRIVSEVVTGTTSASQTQTGTITSEPERRTVGTVLRVTPVVNDDKFVTMVIEPEVSRVITSTFNSSFQDPNRRLARTTVMVPDGGTAMIAGLISGEHTDAARRVPGLGDLPLLGLPFKRTEMEKKNTEIVLFITPHILGEGQTELKKIFAKEREQVPISAQEEILLQGYRKRILKERSIIETIDSIAW